MTIERSEPVSCNLFFFPENKFVHYQALLPSFHSNRAWNLFHDFRVRIAMNLKMYTKKKKGRIDWLEKGEQSKENCHS